MDKDAYPFIYGAQNYTQEKLALIRKELQQALDHGPYSDAITLVATGSYGRGEATAESDMDWFMIFNRDQPAEEVIADEIEKINQIISKHAPKSAGDTGTFGKDAVLQFSAILRNIGGEYDTNETLTRRLLFLLEGTWLYGDQRFHEYREQLLEKYIKPNSPKAQIPRFLLNDIIRYYRTIATDFEFKTSEKKKEWGLRNIKLRFSRKLIYFSGVIVAAELHDLDQQKKIDRARQLFDKPVLKRIKSLSTGIAAKSDVFSAYESFTQEIADPAIRGKLEQVRKESRDECPEYVQLKEAADEFSKALHTWLVQKYPESHPIHHALVF